MESWPYMWRRMGVLKAQKRRASNQVGSAVQRSAPRKCVEIMDNWIIFCGAMAGFLAISLPLVAFVDWLQKKFDESEDNSDEQQNNEQQ